jgi:hypothetical protein
MYNLLSIILNDIPELPDTRRTISLLKSDIRQNFKNTFTSKRTQPNTGEGGNVYHDRQVVGAFTRAGYKLESYDDDGILLEPINKVKQPSTMSVDLN